MPEMYMVGLQEMVDLEVIGSVMCSKDLDRMHDWELLVQEALNKVGKKTNYSYTLMARKVMFGCYIMLFARKDVVQRTSLKNF